MRAIFNDNTLEEIFHSVEFVNRLPYCHKVNNEHLEYFFRQI